MRESPNRNPSACDWPGHVVVILEGKGVRRIDVGKTGLVHIQREALDLQATKYDGQYRIVQMDGGIRIWGDGI